ncbi:DUF2339 domain-containing protein, partial [Acidihalobacter prosperus]
MTWVFILLGAGVGLVAVGAAGALLGAVLGFLLGRVVRMGDQINALLDEQRSLREQLSGLRSQESTGEPAAEAGQEELRPKTVGAPHREERKADTGADVEQPATASVAPRPLASHEVPLAKKAWTGQPAPRSAASRERAAEGLGRSAGIAYRFLTEGNVVAKIGVIVLFFGLAFLLKYAADRDLFPIEARLVLVGAGGIVLLGLGWLLRRRHTAYALVLQGGGIGIVYLTLYAAFRLYGLLPATPAFVLMLAVVAGAAALAVLQDARSLAALGIVGGFLAPVLAGTDSGRHTELFTYYLLLDLGILIVAWRKAWRELNLLGFMFTFVIGTAWGVLRYKPALFATTEPFLLAFFLVFLVTAVLFAHRRAQGHRDYVQSTLVFGPPLVGFGLQASLV